MIVDNEQINDLSSFLNQSEKGNDSIVIQIGSHSIKFGFASQFNPFVIPTCIAYKLYNNLEPGKDENEMIIDSSLPTQSKFEINDSFLSNLLTMEQEIVKKELKLEQKSKGKKSSLPTKPLSQKISSSTETDIPERKNFEQQPNSTAAFKKIQNMSFDLNDDVTDNNFKWTSISSDPKYLVGREALCIAESSLYVIKLPIKYGYFNPDYSFQSVIEDLIKILDFCFVQILKLQHKDYPNYNIVLLIPDLFIKIQVRGLINMFLRYFGFKNIFVHLESVMSTFGLALQSSCVVDIGSSKVMVCCIDEGIIIEESMIRKNIGGDDITNLLYMMIKMSAKKNQSGVTFPIDYFNISNPQHFRIFEKLKENECEFPSIQNPSSQFLPKNSKIWLHKKNSNTKLLNLTMTESAYIPPLSVFYPEIIESFRNTVIPYTDINNDIYSEMYSDPEDVMAELIKSLASTEKKEDERNPQGALGSSINNLGSSIKKSRENVNDDDSISISQSRSEDNSSQFYEDHKNLYGKKNTYESMFKLLPIDDLICQSIMSVSNIELRKKLSNAILLVGGGAKFKGMIDYLEDRLIDKLTQCDNEIDRVEIINFPNIDVKTLAWIGGTIIPKLESAKDMWISRERWLGEPEKLEETKEISASSHNIKEKDTNIKDKENISIINETESKKDGETNKEKAEKTEKKKKERHLDGGVKLLREKSPFIW